MSVWLRVLCVAALAVAVRPETYTSRWDSVDVDRILKNERLLRSYFRCIMDQGRCSSDGAELRNKLREVLSSDCAKCTEKQKENIEKVMNYLYDKRPEMFSQLEKKYDPQGTYRRRHEKGSEVGKAKGTEAGNAKETEAKKEETAEPEKVVEPVKGGDVKIGETMETSVTLKKEESENEKELLKVTEKVKEGEAVKDAGMVKATEMIMEEELLKATEKVKEGEAVKDAGMVKATETIKEEELVKATEKVREGEAVKDAGMVKATEMIKEEELVKAAKSVVA